MSRRRKLTSETPDTGEHSEVPGDVGVLPARRDVSRHPEGRGVSGAHDDKHNDKDDEKADVEDTGDKLNPGNQLEGVDVQETVDKTHGNDQDRGVPSTGDVVGVVERNHGLEQDDGDIGDGGKQRDVTKPCGPTLNPCRKSLDG